MKRILAWILALTLALGLAVTGFAEAPKGRLVILHTNDVHGRAVADPAGKVLGYAAIAQYKKDLEAAGDSVLLLDAGDASQGTPLVNLSMGKTAIEFMNAAGYDAITPGNHEFDWGLDNARQLAGLADFPMLSANIINHLEGDLTFVAHKIFDMPNGMKVGVFGLTTPETMTKAHPDKVRGIDFLQGEALYEAARKQVEELKAAGADIIVLLSHLGMDEESAPNRSQDVLENATGIDLVIDGHSHTLLEKGKKVGDTLVVSTGYNGQNLGVVVYDGEKFTASLFAGLGKSAVVEVEGVPYSALLSAKLDPEVAELVNSTNRAVKEELSKVFAKTEVFLNGERDPGNRTEETNLGDFAADAILWAAKQALGDQVAAAITNGGGIRASIQVGDITMNDMKTVFPFGNEVSVLEVKGSELLEALEAATSATPKALGAFPQVSGIVFSIDTTVPYENGEQYPDSTYYAPAKPGSRVKIESVGGQPFDPEALYIIATNDFTAAGGDTYYAFRYPNATSGYKTGVALEDALVNYVTTVLGGVVGQDYANPQGRITVIK
ncbi:MAG TPA: bifunctional UDP-sugar hydrolase/5'-nucleotidase [Clostridia bacterium]|jgi:2',3'-cyclic-nucleotide 2'-phosphodiesterase (5'-nucleotidase family)|nr:bifunctional UDP-sugar hydrolase/5'-nucleotidase [Clostridia bacterium]HPY42797.1 bifunctional UDP-sugar hydrolase/5'-nucleotidase [Clostridia bacterium]HQA96900.1 bifunctional UDP-sugar hydrolase/5'-nucleotidase [Clostridia bacterium]HQO56298.1 bifunctional UDP-sugar hydrolase/5'-nucleotidase [Clostridia bacterium]